MIKDIIESFERQFNIFSEKSGAFTSHFICDEDSAIATLYYNSFNVEFEYCLDCGILVEKSGLNVIIDFSKKHSTPLKCMMYDIIELLDSQNYNCWFYCFIENPKRMELCFDRLASDFLEILPKIKDFCQSKENMNKIEAVVAQNIKTATDVDYYDDIKAELEHIDSSAKDDVYDDLFSLYFSSCQSIFASNEYRDFLAGNWKKSYKRYKKKKKRLSYENHLLSYMKSENEPKEIIPEQYQCLKDGLREYTRADGFLPFAISVFPFAVLFFILFLGLYFLFAFLLNSSAIYATATEPYNAMSCFVVAFVCGAPWGYFLNLKIYKWFSRKNQKRLDYCSIFNNQKTESKMNVFSTLIYILALISVFLFANHGVSFSETGITDHSSYFSIYGKYYSYNDVEKITYSVDKYEEKCYEITFDDGNSVELWKFAYAEDVEENILPFLKSIGFEPFEENS